MAVPFAVGQLTVGVQHNEPSDARRECPEHHRAGEPVRLHDVATGADIDKSSVGHPRSSCCGSQCASAVSPQPVWVLQFATPRFRCEPEPTLKIDDGTLARRYRPPIA